MLKIFLKQNVSVPVSPVPLDPPPQPPPPSQLPPKTVTSGEGGSTSAAPATQVAQSTLDPITALRREGNLNQLPSNSSSTVVRRQSLSLSSKGGRVDLNSDSNRNSTIGSRSRRHQPPTRIGEEDNSVDRNSEDSDAPPAASSYSSKSTHFSSKTKRRPQPHRPFPADPSPGPSSSNSAAAAAALSPPADSDKTESTLLRLLESLNMAHRFQQGGPPSLPLSLSLQQQLSLMLRGIDGSFCLTVPITLPQRDRGTETVNRTVQKPCRLRLVHHPQKMRLDHLYKVERDGRKGRSGETVDTPPSVLANSVQLEVDIARFDTSLCSTSSTQTCTLTYDIVRDIRLVRSSLQTVQSSQKHVREVPAAAQPAADVPSGLRRLLSVRAAATGRRLESKVNLDEKRATEEQKGQDSSQRHAWTHGLTIFLTENSTFPLEFLFDTAEKRDAVFASISAVLDLREPR